MTPEPSTLLQPQPPLWKVALKYTVMVAAVAAGVLQATIDDGVSPSEWCGVVIAVAAALGIGSRGIR